MVTSMDYSHLNIILSIIYFGLGILAYVYLNKPSDNH